MRECSKERGAEPPPLAKVTEEERSVRTHVSVKGKERESATERKRQRLCAVAMIKSFLILAFECLVFDAVKKKKAPPTQRSLRNRGIVSQVG